MEPRQLTFFPAKIIEPDIGRRPTDIIEKHREIISDDTAFSLLNNLLMMTPLHKVYKELKDIYENKILNFTIDSEYSVEEILGRSINQGQVYYWIKWEGWPPSFNSWEPEENLDGCEDMINEFTQKNPYSATLVKLECNTSKEQQISDVIDRLKEAKILTGITSVQMLQLFLERLKPKTSTLRRFRYPKSFSDKYVEGERLIFCKRPRWTPKVDVTFKLAISQFERMLNTVYSGEAPIYIENKVDLECPPTDFQPIRDYVPHQDIILPTKAIVGCDCYTKPTPLIEPDKPASKPSEMESCWINRNGGCCAVNSAAMFPYTSCKRLRVPLGHPVYECNSMCSCGPSCPFRVVQLGRQVPLTIFRTANGRGWGIRSNDRIPKGTFVCEYLGEIITSEEAESRGESYDKQRMTYLFDLDFAGEAKYTVDAYEMGNVSHFINHSCDPNLTVRCVFIECMEMELPRIALFAARTIRKNEELTFDYFFKGFEEEMEEEGELDEDNAEQVKERPDQDVSERINRPNALEEIEPKKGSVGRVSNVPLPFEGSCSTGTPDTFSEVSSISKSSSFTSQTTQRKKMKCLCGSKNCRGTLFG